jgi:hypothetical protein
VVTAVYLQNRLPTKSLTGRTPYEAWHGRKPAVNHLRVFGCRAFVKQLSHVDKLADQSRAGVFIGYAEGAKAYRILDLVAQQVCTARDVVFNEACGWDWTETTGVIPTADFTIEYIYAGASGAVAVARPASPHAPSSPTPSVRTMATPPSTPVAMPSPQSGAASHAGPAAPPSEFVTPLENDEARLDAAHRESPMRYRAYDNIIGAGEHVPGLAVRNLIEELNLMSTGEPCTFAKAEQDAAWQAAMQEEIDSVKRNQTWELADLPQGHRAITLKWVYKLKRNEAGEIVKHKARLVTRGFVQQEGIDFNEVFTPVARMESVRLLALAAQEGWRVHHMDVKSAFLNGDLKEKVYVRQLAGFVIAGQEGKVLRLRKVLYGLRQAPRAWNSKLDDTLKKMDFVQSEHVIYRHSHGNDILLVGVYVDDLVITGSSLAAVEEFKEKMKRVFLMSDLGLLSFYLGIEVRQDARGITLRQAHYAKKILEMVGMADCKAAATPMEERLRLSRDSTTEEVDATLYRRIVGSLQYLIHTQPDLTYAVEYVSRFLKRPTEEHLQAVKKILRYIAGTLQYGLRYGRRTGTTRLVGYCAVTSPATLTRGRAPQALCSSSAKAW